MGAGRLVAIAVVIALVCMGGLTARAVVSSGSCNSQPVVLNVSVSNDLAPAVAAVANSFNKQRATAAGRPQAVTPAAHVTVAFCYPPAFPRPRKFKRATLKGKCHYFLKKAKAGILLIYASAYRL